MWPFQKKASAHPAFPIGKYTLDSPVSNLPGLQEFSAHEYAVMGRTPPDIFLERSWKIQLGTVGGKIYKIAAYLELRTKAEANPAAMQVLNYCTNTLGKPAEQQTGFFVWDTANGNVILQTAETAEGLSINLFETSRSVRQFKRK